MVVLLDSVGDDDVRRVCARYNDRPEDLIEILHAVQQEQGYLTDKSLRTIAHALNISRAEIHGVVSFYHDFKREAQALHTLKICQAEACQAVGCRELTAAAENKFMTKLGGKSIDNEIALEAVYCLGNCALGPAVMIDDELYGRVTPERLDQIAIKHLGAGE